tara:strand:+ start:6530 stop:7294 length:765 start_codon:yes stop_codon:yes gene_type:complete
MLNGKYKIASLIKSGNFGNVYKCIFNNIYYAIKEENNLTTLKHEANIYKELKNVNNIPKLIDFFSIDTKYYLVLELLTFSLKEYKLKKFYSDNYDNKIRKIIIKIFEIIKYVHNYGVVHRDLKPDNICFYNDEPYIIDFGLSKKIIINDKHIEEKQINEPMGSYNFMSLNTVNLIEPSRRDDIESLMFILLYLSLEEDIYNQYDQLKLEDKKDLDNLINIITKYTDKNYITIFNYIRKLKFKQQPNYTYIMGLL